ncbi:MAG TPA: hypothetical protein ENG83_05660 [Nitrospirae bacterium]|nr:hypothetical protein [Nitrospirota bacterium]
MISLTERYNFCAYVTNNPVNFVDPYGLLTWKERAFVTGLGFLRVFGPAKVYIEGLGWIKPIPLVGTTLGMLMSPSELSDPYLGPDGKWYWPDDTPVNPSDASPDDQPCK